jgi:hypothetical protein
MTINKELILIDNDFALTEKIEEVELLDNQLFPQLIFQEFLKQLKVPHLKIEVSNSIQLYQEYPNLLEQANDNIIFKNILKSSVNKVDLINYYLVCYVLNSSFNIKNVYFDNSTKSTLFFQSQMPFLINGKIEMPKIVKQLIKESPAKYTEQLLERFFILIGSQFEDKLLIYLTFIESKYKFKLDKKGLIKTVFNPLRFQKLKKRILNNL